MSDLGASVPPGMTSSPSPQPPFAPLARSLSEAIGVEAVSSSSQRSYSTSTSTIAPSQTKTLPGNPQPSPPSQPPRPTLLERLDRACLNLPPSFFSINMGTGITSILLYNLPYNARWLQILGTIIFVLNVVIFVLLALGNIVRYARFKGVFTAVTSHTLAGMFWGCLPMGLVTIVNMIAFVCVPAWGYRWALVALGLWWIDVVLSILVNLGMIFMMFTRQKHMAETMTAAWLLPIVSSVVAAASGGVVSSALAPFDPVLARSTVIVSYIVWGTGVPLAMFIITLWIYRTATLGVPATGALPSVFLPLGPCGQGSFGIMLLGKVVRELAYSYDVGFSVAPAGATSAAVTASMQNVADSVYAGGLVAGLILWGLGFCWYILAFAMIIDHLPSRRDFFHHSRFSIGLWAITFPIGVFATATTTLATELNSPAFKVLGTILSVQVALHWLYVSVMTLWKCFDGTIFVAPELASFGGHVPVRWARHELRDEEKAQPASSAQA